MEIVNISDYYELFSDLLNNIERAQLEYYSNMFGLGVIEEDKAVGKIIFTIDEGVSEIKSIYVEPEYRRRGFATDLVINAADFVTSQDYCPGFHVEFTCDIEFEDNLLDFFKYLEFDIKKSEDVKTYRTLICDIDVRKLKPAKKGVTIKRYSELTKNEIGLLSLEPVTIENGYIFSEIIEQDISMAVVEDGKLQAILIFSAEVDGLTLQWARVDEKHKSNLVYMFHEAVLAILNKYGPMTMLYIPVINEQSDKLIPALFGDRFEIVESKYEATFEFEYGMMYEEE